MPTDVEPAAGLLLGDDDEKLDTDQELCDEEYESKNDILMTFRIQRTYLLRCVVTAAMGSLLLGYDLGIISGALIPLREDLDLNHVQLQMLTSCIIFTSIIGSVIAGVVADWFGRKIGLTMAATIFLAGSVAMAVSNTFEELIVWRCITGIAVGMGLVICPIFCAELAPKRERGALTSFNELFINVGIPLAYIVGLSLRNQPNDWRWMLGSGAIPAIFLFGMALLLPESPAWMIKHGHLEKAKATISNLVDTTESEETREKVVRKMVKEIKEDMSIAKNMATWSEMFHSKSNRRPLFVGLSFAAGQQLIGTDSLIFYSVIALTHFGVQESTALQITVVMGLLKLAFTLLTTFIVDMRSFGRRVPLLVGATVCVLGMLIMSISSFVGYSTHSASGFITGMLIFISGFGLGYGPLCWLILAEIFQGPFRSKGLSLGSVVNRLSSFLVVATYLSMIHAISLGGTFLFYTFVCLGVLAFSAVFIPDLTGRKLGSYHSS